MFDVPEGFEVPIFRAVLKPRLTLGAPRDWTALMMGIFALSLLWRLWALLPLVVILQACAAWGTAQDPRWFEKAWRVVRYKRYYKC